jgi:hypothetical protein
MKTSKKKITLQVNGELSYDDKSRVMTASARNTLLESVARRYTACHRAGAEMVELKILVVNEMRAAGLELNQCAGPNHEQLTFTVEGSEFCRRQIMPSLPKDATFTWVKACVHLAGKLSLPVTTAAAAEQEMRLVQIALGLIEEPYRQIEHAHARNLFSEFVSTARSVEGILTKLEKESPVQEWGVERLDTFIREWRPVVERYQEACRVRGAEM